MRDSTVDEEFHLPYAYSKWKFKQWQYVRNFHQQLPNDCLYHSLGYPAYGSK